MLQFILLAKKKVYKVKASKISETATAINDEKRARHRTQKFVCRQLVS